MFQLSNKDDEIIYDDFKDDFPYNKVVDNNWKDLWSFLTIDKHPTAYLILKRFRVMNCLLKKYDK